VLTERQQQVLDYIKACISEGESPTIREIQDEFNWKSHTTAVKYRDALIEKGYISAKYGKYRGVRMCPSHDCTEG